MLTTRRHVVGRSAALAALAVAGAAPRRLHAATAEGERLVWVWSDALWCGVGRHGLVATRPRHPNDLPPVPVAGGVWARGPAADELAWWPAPPSGPSALSAPPWPSSPCAPSMGPARSAGPVDAAGPVDVPAWRRRLPGVIEAVTATADGRWAAVAAAGRLHLMDRLGADSLAHTGHDLAGRPLGAVRALAALTDRRSLLVDWTGGGEWWELSLDPAAAPIYDGLVHDWRLGEALPRPGYRQPRRLALAPPPAPPPALRATWPQRPWVLAEDAGDLLVVHLDNRRAVWRLPGAGAALAVPRALVDGPGLQVALADRLLVVDTRRWQTVVELRLPGVADALATAMPHAGGRASATSLTSMPPVRSVVAMALVAGTWWRHDGKGWRPADGLPAGVEPGLSDQAVDGTLACIGRPPGCEAGTPAGLWCRQPNGATWTAALPAGAGPWRGVAVQPG